jgi:hypothetical protein
MLESVQLLLGPWTGKDRIRQRAIHAPETGRLLGRVQAVLPSWLWWLGRQVQEVLETEDDCLLMTLRRPWGLARTWEVFDAEERRVGMVFRNLLLDGDGRHVAQIRPKNNYHSGRFCDPHGTELGTFASQESGTLLTFSPALEGKPFTRMILLGAVLSLG